LLYVVCGHLVLVFPFWYVWTKENLAALLNTDIDSVEADRNVGHGARFAVAGSVEDGGEVGRVALRNAGLRPGPNPAIASYNASVENFVQRYG
jgi:hypothetical protein